MMQTQEATALPAITQAEKLIGVTADGSLGQIAVTQMMKASETTDLNEIMNLPLRQEVTQFCAAGCLNGPSDANMNAAYAKTFRIDNSSAIQTLRTFAPDGGGIYHRIRASSGMWWGWKKVTSATV